MGAQPNYTLGDALDKLDKTAGVKVKWGLRLTLAQNY